MNGPSEPGADASPYVPLPTGLTDSRRVAGAVFDGIAGLYDRVRPGYPPEALRDLVRLSKLTASSRVLEVGCGTGQLTRDLAATGASILALEPGTALAALARKNLAGHRNVEILTVPFEDLDVTPATWDLIVAATAFHWVDPAVGYTKAADLLRPGGFLGLLNNAHVAGGSHSEASFAEPVRRLHRHIAPEVGDWTFPTAEEIERRAKAGGDIAAVWARVERKLGDAPDVSSVFEAPTVRCYPWLATYDGPTYRDVLATHSAYALLADGPRTELLDGIARLVDDVLGGEVTKQYVSVLAVARRRAGARDPAGWVSDAG